MPEQIRSACISSKTYNHTHLLTHAITPLIQNYTYLFCMFDWCLAHLALVAAQDFRSSVCVCVCRFFCGQSMFNYIFIVAPVWPTTKTTKRLCASVIHPTSELLLANQPVHILHIKYTYKYIYIIYILPASLLCVQSM